MPTINLLDFSTNDLLFRSIKIGSRYVHRFTVVICCVTFLNIYCNRN